ncbi:MAG: metalloregulator ArsR/SmtB family transcription factor [Leptospirales bacterium]|nr:metalloregulator ArsR/SmtB family transcription factor [Leptospirales bacterium]
MSNLDRLFSALGDPTRRSVVEQLSRGPCTVGDLRTPRPISAPALSRHLRILEQCGWIERRAQGAYRRLALRSAALRALSEWLRRQEKAWKEAAERKESSLQKPERPRRPGLQKARRRGRRPA